MRSQGSLHIKEPALLQQEKIKKDEAHTVNMNEHDGWNESEIAGLSLSSYKKLDEHIL